MEGFEFFAEENSSAFYNFSFLNSNVEDQDKFLKSLSAADPMTKDDSMMGLLFDAEPLKVKETAEELKKKITFSNPINNPEHDLGDITFEDQDRTYKIIENTVATTPTFDIEIKTRSDKASMTMPERLYSSLKYEIRQTISAKVKTSKTSNVLMCKLQIVEPNRPNHELLKSNGERFITGMQETVAMTLSKDRKNYEVKTKIQFTDVSFNYEKKNFAMKLSFFDPSVDINKPVLVILSAPFQVFARRPTIKKSALAISAEKIIEKMNGGDNSTSSNNQKVVSVKAKKLGEKRKISVSTKKETTAPSPKKARKLVQSVSTPISLPTITPSNPFDHFSKILDLLVTIKDSLNPEEQMIALQLADSTINSIVPASPMSSTSEDYSDSSEVIIDTPLTGDQSLLSSF